MINYKSVHAVSICCLHYVSILSVKCTKLNNFCIFQKTQSEKSESGEKEAKRIEELYENFQKEQLRNKYLQDEVNLHF